MKERMPAQKRGAIPVLLTLMVAALKPHAIHSRVSRTTPLRSSVSLSDVGLMVNAFRST
jgi:hypothetical protein